MKTAGGLELWAHRGMFHGTTIPDIEPLQPARFVENTLPALRAAANNGYSPEFDVMATKDGYAIVTHGDDNGALGIGHESLPVNKTTREELREFGLVAKCDYETDTLPSTLEVILMALLTYKNIRPNLELKGPGSAEATMKTFRSAGISDQAVNERFLFSSFELPEIVSFRNFYPQAAIALLLWSQDRRLQAGFIESGAHHFYNRFITSNRLCALHVDLPLADEGMVEWGASLGLSEGVRAYTCNSAEQAVELHARGIRGIFTDFPAILYKELS